jgi:chloramphenicol O-acetyltransferase type A
MGRFIDLADWKRREHYELFRDAVQPFFSITAEVDVTALRERSTEPDGPPFLLAALFATLQAANAVEAFRLRIRGDDVWLHDRVGISSTILREDDTFAFAFFGGADSLDQFVREGREELQRAKTPAPLLMPTNDNDALVYHSSIPWLRFTAFTNAINAADSVPRIVFGKRTQVGDRWVIPVAVEVHHALVDGIDVARFFERLQTGVNRF